MGGEVEKARTGESLISVLLLGMNTNSMG